MVIEVGCVGPCYFGVIWACSVKRNLNHACKIGILGGRLQCPVLLLIWHFRTFCRYLPYTLFWMQFLTSLFLKEWCRTTTLGHNDQILFPPGLTSIYLLPLAGCLLFDKCRWSHCLFELVVLNSFSRCPCSSFFPIGPGGFDSSWYLSLAYVIFLLPVPCRNEGQTRSCHLAFQNSEGHCFKYYWGQIHQVISINFGPYTNALDLFLESLPLLNRLSVALSLIPYSCKTIEAALN
jgi:hypothetical protein